MRNFSLIFYHKTIKMINLNEQKVNKAILDQDDYDCAHLIY